MFLEPYLLLVCQVSSQERIYCFKQAVLNFPGGEAFKYELRAEVPESAALGSVHVSIWERVGEKWLRCRVNF